MVVFGLSCCFSELDEEFVPELPRWFGHDAAAALVRDGAVLAAVEEERLNRIKHTNKFCSFGIPACLQEAGLGVDDIDRVAYFFTEWDTEKELGLLYMEHPAVELRSSRSLMVERLATSVGGRIGEEQISFVPHHLAHAYLAHFQSGFERSLVAVVDGSGDAESTSLYSADGPRLDCLRTYSIDRSLGHLYETAIQLLAYRTFDEYKVMGLAPHGDPSRYRHVFRSLYELTDDGGYEMDFSTVRSRFLRAGFRPRRRGEAFTAEHRDFAAGLQETLETIACHVIGHARRLTGHSRLCVAGGVGLNCTLNARLMTTGWFERTFFHPVAHDAGAAVGAAMYVCHQEEPDRFRPAPLRHVYWGPGLGEAGDVERCLLRWRSLVEARRSEDVCAEAAASIAEGAIAGWVQGRSEFGPRALGNRSILADPRPAENRERINAAVKKREAYRPFAPSVLAEEAIDWFEIPAAAPPLGYMIAVVEVRPERRALLGAVTHVDGTARIQTVDRPTNERFWRLIAEFGRLTGVPVLLNTSFNNDVEPIVQTVEDAMVCFLTTKLDVLVVEDWVVRKRRWDADAHLDLVPSLPAPARLRTTRRPLGPGRAQDVHSEIHFSYTGGRAAPLSPAALDLLGAADGRRSLRQLGATLEVLTEVLALWERRFVRLCPL